MTSDEFNSQFRLLKQISAKGGRSYTAEDRGSGRAVLVHILEEDQVGGLAGVDALLEKLPARDKPRVLDRMLVDQTVVVVTQFLQGFESFEGWLQGRTSAAPARPLTSSDPPLKDQGDFTRLFRSSGEGSPASPGRPPPVPEAAPAPAAPPGSKFTDLFRAPVKPAPPGEDSSGRAMPPVRMVGLRVPPQPGSASPPPPELPRLRPDFGGTPETVQPDAGLPRSRDVVIRNPEPFDQPPPRPGQGPSEFTRQLGRFSETGEFSETAAPSEPDEKPADQKRSYLPLILVLNLIFILATGVIVYFLLKRC